MKQMNVKLQSSMQYSYKPNAGMAFGSFWLPEQQYPFTQFVSIQSPSFRYTMGRIT